MEKSEPSQSIKVDHEHVLDVLEQLTIGVLKKAQLEGIAGRLAEVKIRYTGFETHTHGRSIPVAMDDIEVFLRQVRRLFAENVHQEENTFNRISIGTT